MLTKDDIFTMIERSPRGYSNTIKGKHHEFYTHINESFIGNTWAEKLGVFLYGKPSCEHCGKPTRFVNIKEGFKRFCSDKCDKAYKLANSDIQRQLSEQPTEAPLCAHPDCSHPVPKKKDGFWKECCSDGCRGKYNSLSSREKAKKTMMSNHGVEHALQSDTIFNGMQDTFEKKHGTRNPMHLQESKDKLKVSNKERYGRSNPAQRHLSEDVLSKINNPEWLTNENETKSLKHIAIELGVGIRTICRKFKEFGLEYKHFKDSIWEKEVHEFIADIYDGEIKKNNYAIIPPKEIDIFLPELNLCIECNGTFWHSEKQGKDKSYHVGKTNGCAEKGKQLIHIWEHDWNFKKDIVKSRLRAKIGLSKRIYARKCELRELSTTACEDFFEHNHLQGNVHCPSRYGLFYNGTLVASMTFKKPRFASYDLELIRYSTLQGHTVVGGASKLFKHAIKTLNPSSVISYADRMWNTGNLYEHLGFEFKHMSEPNFYYTRDYIELHNRMKFQKHKQSDKLEVFDKNLTASENMVLNKYDKVWDCGNSVWIWEKEA